MPGIANPLTPHEAAAAADISVRDMHRAFDEGIVPDSFVDVRDGARRFDPAASVLMAYYVGLADEVPSKERRRVVHASAPYVTAQLDTSRGSIRPGANLATAEARDAMDTRLRTVIAHVRERLHRLEAARALVTTAPEILNGTTVIVGTRIPVHYVAETYDREGLSAVRSAYPDLDDETIALAKLYADTHPPRGRPPRRTVPEGATVRKSWRARQPKARAGA